MPVRRKLETGTQKLKGPPCSLSRILNPLSVCLISRPAGLVDVPQRPVAQVAHFRIVFFAVDVGMRLLQCLDRPEQAAAVLSHIDIRMVVDVLPVIDRSTLDLVNRCIDLLNGHIFTRIDPPVARLVIQKPARGAQIRQRMQIAWMPPG